MHIYKLIKQWLIGKNYTLYKYYSQAILSYFKSLMFAETKEIISLVPKLLDDQAYFSKEKNPFVAFKTVLNSML